MQLSALTNPCNSLLPRPFLLTTPLLAFSPLRPLPSPADAFGYDGAAGGGYGGDYGNAGGYMSGYGGADTSPSKGAGGAGGKSGKSRTFVAVTVQQLGAALNDYMNKLKSGVKQESVTLDGRDLHMVRVVGRLVSVGEDSNSKIDVTVNDTTGQITLPYYNNSDDTTFAMMRGQLK